MPSRAAAAKDGEDKAHDDSEADGESDTDDPPVDLNCRPVGSAEESVFVGSTAEGIVRGSLGMRPVRKSLRTVGNSVAHELLLNAHHAGGAEELALLAQGDQRVWCGRCGKDLDLSPPQGEVRSCSV